MSNGKGVKISNNIYDLLASQSMTQAELGRKVGVKREYINRLLNGKIHPSVGLGLKIATALNCKVEDVFIVV